MDVAKEYTKDVAVGASAGALSGLVFGSIAGGNAGKATAIGAGIGAGGEGYTTFTIAGPTGEGLTAAHSFTRQRRCVLVDGFHIV